MAETMLTPSSIKLFGRVMKSLTFSNDTAPFGANNFLQKQLAYNRAIDITGTTVLHKSTITALAVPLGGVADLSVGMTLSEIGGYVHIQQGTVITSVNVAGASIGIFPAAILAGAPVAMNAAISPNFARVYAFSFEGAYYPLPRPSIFLVHGSGRPVGDWSRPSTMDQAGVAGREWDFSGSSGPSFNIPNDLAFWEYEKGDFSLRLDLEAGPFEQILLQMALRSGADRADRSGAGVSGAGVSGAGVSGAGVSGAGVSGAGLRR